ncbi:2-hydroxychromene-2-carboxylate isomerase [Penicillium chermesinum]|uniref:2-hydroxychromene-2-carboxylate isomerase n=1 Tax=Penicillium chermesinum TaxID=63820 RepID=A0A9W9PFS3_9EURO|nr:2-hydroxychromene-2-carboxylate isomerase [Penicillium chermesinum]KAJ5246016.1 2-hydroxychromene-2-carboxylate isomerase [Penicillium chermesinum]
MSSPQITLYFDIGSPFSYLAFYHLKNSPVFSTCRIEYVPVHLKDLFQKCQNPPPVLVKNKFLWLQRERLYWALRVGAPVTEKLPDGFPAATADVQAALAGLSKESPEKLLLVADRLFNIFWAQGDSSIVKPNRFRAIFEEIVGHKEADVNQEGLGTSALSENTQRAFDAGAFGTALV